MGRDLAAARERHRLYSITGHCRDCGFKWPCDAALFRDALDNCDEADRITRKACGEALDAARALADELAHWGAQLAHLAVGLKTGRDLDHVIGEWERAIAKWEASLTPVERAGGAGRCRADRRRRR